MINTEEIFITPLQEALHNDTTGQLVNEITQRLQDISQRLQKDQKHLNSLEVHNDINEAQQAVAGAQQFMQLFAVSNK